MKESKRTPKHIEFLILSICVAFIVLIAIHTATYYLPWGDEMQLVDPGANLYFGNGFTSSVFPFQRPYEFFLGNAPGFSLLLSIWFHLFGFGLIQARALSYACIAVAIVIVWWTMIRTAPKMPSWLRLTACVTAFTGIGITGNIWAARYDALGIMIISLVCFAWSFENRRAALLLTFPLGAAIFLSGFQWVFAIGIISLPIAILWGKQFLRRLRALWTGLAAGALGWFVVLFFFASPKKFLMIMFGSQLSIVGQVGQLIVQGDSGVVERFGSWRQTLVQDPGLIMMTVLALSLLFLWLQIQRNLDAESANRLAIFGFWLLIIMPVAVYIFHAYPIYYTSMSFIPAVIISAYVISDLQGKIRAGAYVSFSLVAIASSYLGIVTMAMERVSDRTSFGYKEFEPAVRKEIAKGEPVYADPAAYFAARSISGRVYAHTYGNSSLVSGVPERGSIFLMIVERKHLDDAMARLGGKWSVTAELGKELGLGSRLDFVVARRE